MSGSIVKNPSDIRLNEIINFYVFRVVVGRAYVMKRSALEDKSHNPRSALHPDYDSIYIQDDQDKSSNDYVSHTYRIFDKEKVRLIYKVTAKIKVPTSLESHAPVCEQCKANLGIGREETAHLQTRAGAEQPRPAELYCVNDKTYFCLDHYRDFHQSSILQSHMSIPAREKPLTFGECPKHKKRYEFFNTELYQALCSQCIVTGDMQQTRSAGVPGAGGAALEPSDKRILRIEDAHTNACAEAVAEDVSLTEKKHVIQTKLQQIMAKMQHIKENAMQVTEKINQILMNALNDIDKHVRAKTDQLKSDRTELNRQLYEILYAEAFIKK